MEIILLNPANNANPIFNAIRKPAAWVVFALEWAELAGMEMLISMSSVMTEITIQMTAAARPAERNTAEMELCNPPLEKSVKIRGIVRHWVQTLAKLAPLIVTAMKLASDKLFAETVLLMEARLATLEIRSINLS